MKYHTMHLFWGFTLLTLAAGLLPGGLWAQGNFIYTNDDQSPNTVSAFSVASDGALTAVAGSPFATGGTGNRGGLFSSNRIGVAVVGNFLFASNSGSNDVSVFTIDPNSGSLTPVDGSPFATGGVGRRGIAVSPTPDGSFLMAANSDSNNITVFSIASNGALTAVAGSPFATLGMLPDGIKVGPDGKFLAVAEVLSKQVEMFSIGSSGSLTSLGTFPEGGTGNLAGVDIDCSGNFLYGGEANSESTIVDGYTIASSGGLTPIAGSPFLPEVGTNSNVVLLSPDDKTLFVSNQDSNTITAFSVESTGSLSLLAGSPFAMNGPLAIPSGMATSQDGTLLYVADIALPNLRTGAVSVFSVAPDGTPSEVTGSPFSTGRPGGLLSLTAYPPKACVGIEIKPPASAPVPINPQAKGKIPVAILSTLAFNAVIQVNTSSLTFGHTGNEASLAFCGTGGEDVNGDGLVDLVCHFNTPQPGFVAGDTRAFLKGQSVTGRRIQGSEGITSVPK